MESVKERKFKVKSFSSDNSSTEKHIMEIDYHDNNIRFVINYKQDKIEYRFSKIEYESLKTIIDGLIYIAEYNKND